MECDDWIDFAEVRKITGYSRAHIDRLEWDPKYKGDDPFPARFMYGNSRVLWKRTEVVAWVNRRIKPMPCRPKRTYLPKKIPPAIVREV